MHLRFENFKKGWPLANLPSGVTALDGSPALCGTGSQGVASTPETVCCSSL
jgi:hypothetical protein